MEMKFKTKMGDYMVDWSSAGWAYAVAHVYKLKTFSFLWMKFNKYVFVWESGSPRSRLDAEKMMPDRMKAWFESAISEYENYQKEWSKFNSDGKCK